VSLILTMHGADALQSFTRLAILCSIIPDLEQPKSNKTRGVRAMATTRNPSLSGMPSGLVPLRAAERRSEPSYAAEDGFPKISLHVIEPPGVWLSLSNRVDLIVRGELQIKRGEHNRLLPDGEFEFITNLVDDSDLIEMKDNLANTFFRGWIERYAEQMDNMPSHNALSTAA
jgi:hypothetical protein